MIIHRDKIPVLAVALCVLATATAAHADGTHGCQTEITNNTSADLYVATFNSNDAACMVQHKTYSIEPGGTKRVTAHSQGQSHCKMKIQKHNERGTRMCVNDWCGARHITKTGGKTTSIAVNGVNDCPPAE